MNTSNAASNRNWLWSLRAAAAAGVVGVTVGLAGCGEMITYGADARQQGIRLYNDGKFADAAGSFNNAIRQDPRDYQSYYYLGRSYDSLKQYHQSVPAYRTALNVMSSNLAGREDAAFRMKILDGLATAAAGGNSRDLEQAAMQNRQQPGAEDHFVQAKIARIHGDVDSAVEAYERATLVDPANITYAREFGLFLAQLGQNQRAAAQLTRAYVLNSRARQPEDPQVVNALRQVGVVPGPSLGEERDLVKPPVPVGPLPAADDVAKFRLQNPIVKEEPGGPSAGTAEPRE